MTNSNNRQQDSKIVSSMMNTIELVQKAKIVKFGLQTEDGWKLEVWKLIDK